MMIKLFIVAAVANLLLFCLLRDVLRLGAFMDGKQKMSQFGSTTLAAAKTAGAGVPVFIAGQSNKQIPASEIAGAADLSTVATNLGYVSAFIAIVYSEDASYTAGNVVWHDNAVYRANANTSGAWDSTKWDAVNIGTIFAEIGGVETLLAAL